MSILIHCGNENNNILIIGVYVNDFLLVLKVLQVIRLD